MITALRTLVRTASTFRADVNAFFGGELQTFAQELNDTIGALSFSAYSSTSTTSNVIGTGSKSFTVQAGKNYTLGQTLIAVDTANIANWMIGQVSSYNSGTGALVMTIATTGGSGTKTAWTINVTSVTAYVPNAVIAPTIVTSSSTINAPATARGLKLIGVGGGGGGAAASFGGTAGGAVIATIPITPGTACVCVIGAAGAIAGSGGNTTITIGATVYTANGGVVGANSALGGTASGGDLNLQGNPNQGSGGAPSIFGGAGVSGSIPTAATGYGSGGTINKAGFQGVAIFDWIT